MGHTFCAYMHPNYMDVIIGLCNDRRFCNKIGLIQQFNPTNSGDRKVLTQQFYNHLLYLHHTFQWFWRNWNTGTLWSTVYSEALCTLQPRCINLQLPSAGTSHFKPPCSHSLPLSLNKNVALISFSHLFWRNLYSVHISMLRSLAKLVVWCSSSISRGFASWDEFFLTLPVTCDAF